MAGFALPAVATGALKLGGIMKGLGALATVGTAGYVGIPPIYDITSGNAGREAERQIYKDFAERLESGESSFEDTGVSLNPWQRLAGLDDEGVTDMLTRRTERDVQKEVDKIIGASGVPTAVYDVKPGQTSSDAMSGVKGAIKTEKGSIAEEKDKREWNSRSNQYLRWLKEKEAADRRDERTRLAADKKEIALDKLRNERLQLGIAQQQQANKLTMHQRELAANRDLRRQELIQQLGMGLASLGTAFTV